MIHSTWTVSGRIEPFASLKNTLWEWQLTAQYREERHQTLFGHHHFQQHLFVLFTDRQRHAEAVHQFDRGQALAGV